MVSGWPDTRLLELVGSELPIVQAPMANAGGVELCIGAIDGGALGSLPCGMLSPDQVREQVEAVRHATKGPLNLNFFCHSMPEAADDSSWKALLEPYYQEFGVSSCPTAALRQPFDESMSAVVEEIRPEVVSFHFGLPESKLMSRVKASGAVVLSSATTVDEARWLEERGADAVIAQGFEAGGHSGRFLGNDPAEAMGLIALLPQIVDAVRVPVVAAGGIGDGRGIAAAFALGASGVQLGTAFLHCPESLLTLEQRQLLKDRATIFTNVYSGGLARALRGRLVDELGAVRAEVPPYPLGGRQIAPLLAASKKRGDFEFIPNLAGQAGPLGFPLPAEDLSRRLALQALAILRGEFQRH